MLKRFLAASTLVLNLLALWCGIPLPTMIYRNVSESLPYHYFLAHPLKSVPEVEDFVLFRTRWVDTPLVKRVAGVEGDLITVKNGSVYLNGSFQGAIPDDSLERLSAIQPGPIPKGRLYVSGTHRLSFDSRYAECGLVCQEDVISLVLPLF